MNWKKIRKKYPESWKYLVKHNNNRGDFGFGEMDYHNILIKGFITVNGDLRYLYDFFDELGVYINITRTMPDTWCTVINLASESGGHTTILKNRNSRPRAEKSAFKKAFSVLEHRLKVDGFNEFYKDLQQHLINNRSYCV